MFCLLARLEPFLRRPVWTVPSVITLDTWPAPPPEPGALSGVTNA